MEYTKEVLITRYQLAIRLEEIRFFAFKMCTVWWNVVATRTNKVCLFRKYVSSIRKLTNKPDQISYPLLLEYKEPGFV
jgi:hypothetical protein